MNQMIIEHLDAAAWNAKPPGKARSIAAIFTHVHNVRTKWVRLTAPHLKIPRQLQRAHCTPKQAARDWQRAPPVARGCSPKRLAVARRHQEVRQRRLGPPVAGGPGNAVLHGFARSPPSRQVLMLAHQLGFALPQKVMYGLWNWEKLWKECGASGGRATISKKATSRRFSADPFGKLRAGQFAENKNWSERSG